MTVAFLDASFAKSGGLVGKTVCELGAGTGVCGIACAALGAKAILTDTNIDNKRTRDLSEAELTTLRDEVEKYTTEGDLRRFNALNINRLKEIGCYRGRRHINSLPVRGQRTKTNARTRKGKAKTVANKKK